ncbi:hypothetical protein OnM2_060042 [Erysiphe neolycopersici]|uniref:GAG-pre-integrase domain-containing protein n=1 Tax=Erysiphe neolycopersici TaxID=212602 RepID=A0A420HPQ7_9PEZI|nr:hypothetical protein OnM2_060042 [Erysiphe neolycopersici]
MATVGQLSAFIAINSDEYSHIKNVDGNLNVNDEFKTTFKISEISSSNTYELNKSWILDSGATIHFTPIQNVDRKFFFAEKATPLSQPILLNKGPSKPHHGNSSKAPKVQSGTCEDWHIRMSHINHDTLLKLPEVTRGC